MYLICRFEKPANDNMVNDPYEVVCDAFKAACRAGSGVSTKERNRLQRVLLDMTRQTTDMVNEASAGIDTALKRSVLHPVN